MRDLRKSSKAMLTLCDANDRKVTSSAENALSIFPTIRSARCAAAATTGWAYRTREFSHSCNRQRGRIHGTLARNGSAG